MNSLKFSSSLYYFYKPSIKPRGVNLRRGLASPAGTPGAGAGKGGGAGGTVRESGGGLGRFAAAQEEGYFYIKQKEQLQKLKQEIKEGKEVAQKKEE